MEFEKIWQELQSKLSSHLILPNWTADQGNFRGTMMIVNISDDSIEVESPGAKNIQKVRKQDFEEVWRIWPEYKNGKFRRGDMTKLTRFSKYVISIFHWLEMQV
jgi:hypothetical protein